MKTAAEMKAATDIARAAEAIQTAQQERELALKWLQQVEYRIDSKLDAKTTEYVAVVSEPDSWMEYSNRFRVASEVAVILRRDYGYQVEIQGLNSDQGLYLKISWEGVVD